LEIPRYAMLCAVKKSLAYIHLSVCQTVCPLSYDRSFQSVLMKLCIIVRNPKSKTEFVTGQNPTTSSHSFPIFHPRIAFSMARSEHHSNAACGQIVAFDSVARKNTIIMSLWQLFEIHNQLSWTDLNGRHHRPSPI